VQGVYLLDCPPAKKVDLAAWPMCQDLPQATLTLTAFGLAAVSSDGFKAKGLNFCTPHSYVKKAGYFGESLIISYCLSSTMTNN
jgi:hypothetical protein